MFDIIENLASKHINLITLTGMIISFVALVISIFAFCKANSKSKLVLRYKKYKSNHKLTHDNDCFTNEKGFIDIDDDKKEKPIYEFYIRNKNKTVAKNIIVRLNFIDINLDNDKNKEWECTSSYYNKFQYIWKDYEENVHKGVDVKLPLLDFNNYKISNYEKSKPCRKNKRGVYKCKIEVMVSAENMKTEEFSIPIRIFNLYTPQKESN